MYKATASGQQFLAREGMHSTKGSRKGFDLLDQGTNPAEALSDEERRASLVLRWKQLEKQVVNLPKASAARRRIGAEMHELGQQISAIRPKLRGGTEMRDHFISVARERLPKAVYSAIVTEAARRAKCELVFRATDGGDILTIQERKP